MKPRPPATASSNRCRPLPARSSLSADPWSSPGGRGCDQRSCSRVSLATASIVSRSRAGTGRIARTPVKALSGGEKNRLLLAKLFLKPSNLLILDEPTNDLDVETLELLEELLSDYPGTLLLVSHDRRFIDNTVTGCWLFEGDGRISDYVGGYADMMATREQQNAQQQAKSAPVKAPEPVVAAAPEAPKKSKKLSYKLQLELEGLPARLEQLEAELDALQSEINQPGFFSLPADKTQPKLDALNAAEAALEQAFARWEELEGLKNQE